MITKIAVDDVGNPLWCETTCGVTGLYEQDKV